MKWLCACYIKLVATASGREVDGSVRSRRRKRLACEGGQIAPGSLLQHHVAAYNRHSGLVGRERSCSAQQRDA